MFANDDDDELLLDDFTEDPEVVETLPEQDPSDVSSDEELASVTYHLNADGNFEIVLEFPPDVLVDTLGKKLLAKYLNVQKTTVEELSERVQALEALLTTKKSLFGFFRGHN